MVTIFALEELFCTGNYLINKRPLHLTTLAFVDEKLMALQEMIDKENIFSFIILSRGVMWLEKSVKQRWL